MAIAANDSRMAGRAHEMIGGRATVTFDDAMRPPHPRANEPQAIDIAPDHVQDPNQNNLTRQHRRSQAVTLPEQARRMTLHHGLAPSQYQAPTILAVLGSSASVGTLHVALTQRFGGSYRIVVMVSLDDALEQLEKLRQTGADIALAMANVHLDGMSGIDFLARVHTRHPGAKRALLTTTADNGDSIMIHKAMAVGAVDLTIGTSWGSPEETFYPMVSEALGGWWSTHRPGFERVKVVGEQWSARSHELRDLGTRNGIAFGFYPAESEAGERLLRELGLDATCLPVITVADGQVLVNPSNAQIAEALGFAIHAPAGLCDVAIIGAGPAGLTAAVYAASEGLNTVIVEPEALGGQAGTSSMIRNYLGFPRGISGEELTRRAHEQALTFGAHFVHTLKATGLRAEGDTRIVTLSDGSEVASRTVVLATGVAYRRLNIPNLERLVGAGVFYGTAAAEARAMRGEDVFVVGAGNSAGQAALHLAQYAASVTLLVRGESLAASMSEYLIEQIDVTPNIDVRLRTRAIDGQGEHRLEGLVIEDTATGETETVPAAALFVLIGAQPHTAWLDGVVARDEKGYILTCRDLEPLYVPRMTDWMLNRPPFTTETSLPGVFAVGDVRHHSVKRVASAVGEGAISIFAVQEYLAEPCA